jgi:hypothetical protein
MIQNHWKEAQSFHATGMFMSPLYLGLIVVGLLFAYTGLSYTRSQVIRLANRRFLMGRKVVLLGWLLFTCSMTSVSFGCIGLMGAPL